MNSLSGFRRNKEILRIVHVSKFLFQLLCKFLHGFIVLLHQIPLINGNNNTLSGFMGNTGNAGIPIGNSLYGINQNYTNISPVHCGNGSDHRISLNIFRYLTLSSQTGGINKDIGCTVIGHFRINSISGGAGYIRYNDTIFP